MSAKGPKLDSKNECRGVSISLPPDLWRELEREASDNYRPLNAEIAIRVRESLPSNNDRP